MQPHGKDEAPPVDLSKLCQPSQRPQQKPKQKKDGSTPASPDSANPFEHLSALDTPPASAHPAGGSGNTQNTKRHSGHQQQTNGAKNGEHKECPRHAEGHLPNKITRKDLGNRRTLLLYYGSDVSLFERIMTYKLGNPDRHVDDAIDAFSEHQGADALANVIYGTQAFDMVFKYTIPDHRRKPLNQHSVDGDGNGATTAQIDEMQELKQHQAETEKYNRHNGQPPTTRPTIDEKDIEAAVEDPIMERDGKTKRHRHRFIKALLKESMIIESEPNIEGDRMFLKIYTPFWRLCVEAQRLRMKMELTEFQTRDEKSATAAALGKEKHQNWLSRYVFRFLQRADNISLPLRAESLLFKSSKLRQYKLAEKTRKWSDIVRHGGGITPDGDGVGSHVGSDGNDGFFGTAQRGRLTESIVMYSKIHTKHGDRNALKLALDKKAYSDIFPLHDGSYKSKVLPTPNRRTLLFESWVKSRRTQPLEDIRFYYGEKVALYFAWAGYYTKWLISAAIVGFLFFIFGVANYFVNKDHDSNFDAASSTTEQAVQYIFDNALTLPYTIFMTVWSTLFVEYWKRRSNTLVYQWNTLDLGRNERTRPQFKPTGTRISPVTGKKELYYPRYKQALSALLSFLVVLVSVAIVIISVGSLLWFNVKIRSFKKSDGVTPVISSSATSVLTALLNLVVIMILGTIYAKLAEFLTDNENHRRGTQHEAFKVGLTDGCGEGGSCIDELTIQLAIVFVGKQFLNQFQEVAVPKLQEIWNRKKELAERTSLVGVYHDKKHMKKPPQWIKDDALPDFDATMFEEYRELVIQFGFCILFVTAFPVAPIFALLNNVLEIRVDSYKLMTRHRRPVAQPAKGIGSWSAIMELLTFISIFTNACLIAFQSKWMENNVFRKNPWVHPDVEGQMNFGLLAVRLLFIFIFEHVVFFAKAVIAKLVRDVPRTVKLAIERENYYTRLALDDEEPAVDEVLEDVDDEMEDSDDDDDFLKKFLNFGDGSSDEMAEDAEALEEEEDEEELEALIRAGGCGCAAHGDGILGTSKGGFDATWMNRFKPEVTQAVMRRRQQRRRKKQNAHK
ncbi:hypothetical protein BGX21_001252 [Mortierella sp. AD011]|nr:hypothetical protein BGX21_001252 [Mortierella sp. AD011]